ncbi:MAG: cytochrome c biogenesis protein CcdA [bacterium]|nr:cytochrome c biogenesis protein CcdA [bacterium]
MENISLGIAFIGGLVSFLAPCVLPIIPGFLSYLAGSSTTGGAPSRRAVFMNALFFVLGFSVVFAALGVLLNTLLEAVAYDAQIWLSRIGGALVIFFGLYLVGLLKIPFLEREHKIAVRTRFSSRYATSFLFGLAFAAGWTPCVSAALGAILGIAATQPGTAFYLLLSYALGLGLPFLLVGLFAAQATALINRYVGVVRYINIFFGIILIGLGVLMFTGNLSRIANFELLNRWLLR